VNAIRNLGIAVGHVARAVGNDIEDPARFAATAAALIPKHVGAGAVSHHELWNALARSQDASDGLESTRVSLTLVNEPTYSIALEAWTGVVTDIREPGFAGALGVVRGAAVLAPHHFAVDAAAAAAAAAGAGCQLGAVTAAPPRYLGPGASTPIEPGLGYACAALEPATLVVVVCGRPPPGAERRQYLRAGVAFDPAPRPALNNLLAALTLQRTVKDPGLAAHVAAVAADHDAIDVLHVVRHLAPMMDAAQVAALLARIPARHGALCARLAVDDEERRSLAALHQTYDHAVGPGLRSFLAILQLARRRLDVLALVAARAPGADPVETILGWLRELAGQPGIRPEAPNLAGFDVDDTVLDVLRVRLATDSDATALERIVSRFQVDDADLPVLMELLSAPRRAPLLAPLLAEDVTGPGPPPRRR
jgi:hypothetical protein